VRTDEIAVALVQNSAPREIAPLRCTRFDHLSQLSWITAWWRHFGNSLDSRMLAVWDDTESLSPLAPLYTRRLRLAGMPGPVLGLMGDEGVTSTWYLLRRGREEEALAAAANHLKRAGP
jgi:hypothetical protein